MSIPLWLRRNVIQRAGGRCEYCTLSQSGQEARFHIDHVIPVAEGGPTELDNLALACVSCSLRKGARRTALDPVTAKQANLFHPRLENWDSHFRWRGNRVEGITATGRATLRMANSVQHLPFPPL
jgi:5-methylcytosine-specific restriction endonuclease McrA